MNEQVQYLVASGAYSLGGLVLGYLLGRLERDVDDIRRRTGRRHEPREKR